MFTKKREHGVQESHINHHNSRQITGLDKQSTTLTSKKTTTRNKYSQKPNIKPNCKLTFDTESMHEHEKS